MNRLLSSASLFAVTLALATGGAALSGPATANDKLVELAKSDENWPMTGKNYDANNYSPQKQINKENVKDLRPAWSFSTGVLSGHEGTPLVVDGVMYGRGVAVSKSDFTTYAFALDALKRSGLPLKGTVELHLTYDEEIGGEVGPGWILAQGLSRPDYAVSAGFSYAVVVAHNGCLHLEVEVKGKSAHAAIPSTGVDALEAATGILTALYAYRGTLTGKVSEIAGIGAPQLNVGLISGGINTNVVPDKVTFRLDRRIVPEERPEQVEAEVRAVIAEAAAGFPKAEVEVRQVLLARPLVPDDKARHLASVICRHATAVMGEEVGSTGVPLYTDARLYAEAGVPVVLYGAGPHTIQEANGHRADEKLTLSDLDKATLVMALTLKDLLS